jgi:hypothetical protein
MHYEYQNLAEKEETDCLVESIDEFLDLKPLSSKDYSLVIPNYQDRCHTPGKEQIEVGYIRLPSTNSFPCFTRWYVLYSALIAISLGSHNFIIDGGTTAL